METINFTDQFLVAMPGMGDGHFSRSVAYVCQHNEEGALGIVINRPSDMLLGDIMGQMDIEVKSEVAKNCSVFYGGPVQPERGFVIHATSGHHWESTLRVTDSISLTTSRDILESIGQGNGPDTFLIALGYCGWGEGQVEQEMIENSWLSVPSQTDILFNVPSARRWEAAANQIGIDINLLPSQAGHS